MGKYVENNLNKNEVLVKKADKNAIFLIISWIIGIAFCWVLFIPLIKAIKKQIDFICMDLAVTSKRVIGKVGFANTDSMDAPLNKVQNSSVTQTFWGKVFNFGIVRIDTAAGTYRFKGIKNAEAFKRTLMAQIDQAEEDRVKQQAEEMAKAMSGVINK